MDGKTVECDGTFKIGKARLWCTMGAVAGRVEAPSSGRLWLGGEVSIGRLG